MIINRNTWQEVNSYDVIFRNETNLHPFYIRVEVAADNTHSFLGMRGTLETEKGPHTLKNPYPSKQRYPYYRPNNTVADVIKSFLALGYTAQAARQEAHNQVNEDMEIALSSYNGGYSAYCVVVTVYLWVVVDGVAETVKLASRADTGIECKTSPVQDAAIRAIAVELGFTAERAEEADTAIDDINPLDASTEITARKALKASIQIIRYIKQDSYKGQYKQINAVIRDSKRQVPE